MEQPKQPQQSQQSQTPHSQQPNTVQQSQEPSVQQVSQIQQARGVQQMTQAQQPPNPVQSQAPGFAFPTGQHNKVHHTYIWLGSLLGVGAVLLVGLFSSFDDIVPLLITSGTSAFLPLALFALGALLLYGVVAAFTALAYKHLSFVFDEKEFSLYSGILTKQRVHVPYARVQSVNHKQSLVQRLAGVCTVEIDTAGGSSNKAVKVPYVKLDVGEAIRSDLFMRKAASLAGLENSAGVSQVLPYAAAVAQMPNENGVTQTTTAMTNPAAAQNVLDEAALDLGVDNFRGVYGGAFAGLEPVSFERRLSNKELLLASVSHSGIPGLFITAIVSMCALAVPLVIFERQYAWLLWLAIPAAFLFFAVMVALAAGGTALSYGSFSVRRRGQRIEVERGILQRDFSGIDISRIQSLVIRQSFIRRLMGYCEVSLGRVRAGSGEEQNTQASLNAGGLVVHPFIKLDQVDTLLAGLLPEFADRPVAEEFRGLPAVALRRGLLRRGLWNNGLFWLVVIAAIVQLVYNVRYAGAVSNLLGPDGALVSQIINTAATVVYVLFALGLVFVVWGTLWWKRGSGFAMNRRFVAICNDGLSTETTYFPRQKVQFAITRTNPFQRRAHVTTIGAVTAAGIGGSGTELWDVTEEDGQSWQDWLKPRTSVVQ